MCAFPFRQYSWQILYRESTMSSWLLSFLESTSHHETQGSQDALTHFVIPRSTLPLLHGQFKPLSRIFCEERGHLAGKLFIVDCDIDFIVPDQTQAIKIACSDR